VLELLVVLAIIMVMVTIMLPSLKRAMMEANSTVCMHNLKEVGQALHIYRIENDGWLPNIDGVDSVRIETWFVKLFPRILAETRALACPEDPFLYRWRRVGSEINKPEVAEYSSYGLSSFILTGGGGRLANLDRHQPWRPLDNILLADIGPDSYFAGVGLTQGKMQEPERNAGLLFWDDGCDPLDPLRKSPWLTTRHGDGINVLTVGFAVRHVRTSDMIGKPIRSHYPLCAAGGCSLCAELHMPHYSFANQGLYWWTGTLPRE